MRTGKTVKPRIVLMSATIAIAGRERRYSRVGLTETEMEKTLFEIITKASVVGCTYRKCIN